MLKRVNILTKEIFENCTNSPLSAAKNMQETILPQHQLLLSSPIFPHITTMKYSELSIGQFIHALSGGETGFRRQQHLLSYKNLSFSS
jgi:hypothetical protein